MDVAAIRELAGIVGEVVAALPEAMLEKLVDIVATADAFDAVIRRARVEIPHPQYRDHTVRFAERCRDMGAGFEANALALALLSAAASEDRHREQPDVQPVWSGPVADRIPFRHTEQAILEVLDSSQERITLVSYAVYKIPRIAEALVRAARDRNIAIRVIVETPQLIKGAAEYSTLQALGPDVARCATVYYWPAQRRQGKCSGGILHAKCAISDGRRMFVSSANLTEQAFSINLELGVLITGSPTPHRVEERFESLIAAGELQPVPSGTGLA